MHNLAVRVSFLAAFSAGTRQHCTARWRAPLVQLALGSLSASVFFRRLLALRLRRSKTHTILAHDGSGTRRLAAFSARHRTALYGTMTANHCTARRGGQQVFSAAHDAAQVHSLPQNRASLRRKKRHITRRDRAEPAKTPRTSCCATAEAPRDLLPASRPASVYRGVFDHIYIACPPDSRNPFAWLPQKNIFDGLDYGTLAAIEQSLQKRLGRRAVPPPRRRGNRGKRRSRNASRRPKHTRFWHMTALAHDGW